MAPKGAIVRLAASLVSLVVVMMVMVMMVVTMGLCTWDRADRERNGGDGGQNESKLPHKNYSLGWIF